MLLVIARKFNDIYYSMSLPQWNDATTRHLIIISNGIPKESFPNQDVFDKVIFIRYDGESVKNIISVIRKLHSIKIPKAKVVVLSNPILVTNQYIIKRARPDQLIFIEDGSMNYSSFSPSKSRAKKMLQFSLGINEKRILSSINSTFLFYPEKSTFFFGTPMKLELRRNIFPLGENTHIIEGKRLLVGQPLYDHGFLSIERYNFIINEAIKKFDIDFYVPHAFASSKEEIIGNKLNLSDFNVTLEAFASKHAFEIFSLGSTVLYSCKTINPKVRSVLLTIPDEGMQKLDTRFVKSFCDEILPIE